MHLEAIIVPTWMPYSSRFGDALGGRNRETKKMHLVTMIEQDEQYYEAVNLEAVRSGGRCEGSRHSIHWLTRNFTNVEN
jgi:hypothetical protein